MSDILLRGAACATAVLALLAPTSAAAQQAAFPTRPLRIVVPYGPGGTNDVIVRSLAEPMSAALGQPIVVENRAGGGGTVGMTAVARAAPDGYTLGFGNTGPNAIAPVFQHPLAYDPVTDFQPVSLIAEMPLVLMVNASSRISSLKEFVMLARSKPEGLTYGSTGVGSFSNVTGEMFAKEAAAKLIHVPFKSAPEAVQELLAERIDATLSTYLDVVQHLKAGKLRPLAITSAKRHPLLPDVPTVSEVGFPALEAVGWFGIFAPSGTPKPIVDKLYAHILAASNEESFRARISALGFVPVASSPEQFSQRIKADVAKWALVVKRSGIKVD